MQAEIIVNRRCGDRTAESLPIARNRQAQQVKGSFVKVGRVVDKSGAQWIVILRDGQLIPVLEGSPLGALEVIERALTQPIGEPMQLDDVQILPPIQPLSLRDFISYEGHLKNCHDGWGLSVPDEWYNRPGFYTGNARAMSGHGADVPTPDGTAELDYEAEIACVIGTECTNLDPSDPRSLDVIAGFTILNDWSARDLQVHDTTMSVGPGKGKDFANSLGPFIATPDEIAGFPQSPSGRVVVRVNGEERSVGEIGDMSWSWSTLLAVASANVTLFPGDVIGAGTCTGGCIMEHRALGLGTAWLVPGDLVEIQADGIGTLSNRVVGSIGPSALSAHGRIAGWRNATSLRS